MSVEQRQPPRKILRTRAMLVMDGAAAVAAHTLDIGASGVAAVVDEALAVGHKGRIVFEMLVDGKLQLVDGQVAANYCILSHDGFKVGLQFVNLDSAMANAISRYLH
ncbi:PilZ domain-containing protein [Janthinobacterium fluminis]|uniref:PilZ domain-containing protein n=1 Tax=Janthinobacterium fluminis TaxID=2987524 RepID=A0ABT5JU78_9BURK|nr:PilZ domain-containing protein [Janthinobacterium fluminis]MDC8756279.1 PilZ domain-containing protein [Janthinobacterium fluminis]